MSLYHSEHLHAACIIAAAHLIAAKVPKLVNTTLPVRHQVAEVANDILQAYRQKIKDATKAKVGALDTGQ